MMPIQELKAAALAAKPIEIASELLECDHCIEKFHALANPTTILALLERLQIAEDAARRYQWLRDQDIFSEVGSVSPYAVRGQSMEVLDGEELDKACDAAITAKEPIP